MQGFLVILVGLPSSGKSTIAQAMKEHFAKYMPQPCPIITIIDPDRYRGENPGRLEFHPGDEPKIKEKVMEETARQVHAGNIVIVDDLNYYQSMRHDLLQISLKEEAPYLIIFVNTPLNTCKAWNKLRGYKIPDEVIDKVALKFDYFERYAWDQPDFTIDPSSAIFSLDEFLTLSCVFLEKNLHRRAQLQGKNSTKVMQPASIKQLLDVRSRKILSEYLGDKTRQSKPKEFLKIRRSLLSKNPMNLEETEQILQEFRNALEKKAKEI